MLHIMNGRGMQIDPATQRWSLTLWSPDSSEAWLVVDHLSPAEAPHRVPMERRRETWWAELPRESHGVLYHVEVDGVGPLLDPYAWAVRLVDGVARNVLRTQSWPEVPRLDSAPLDPDYRPVVYEVHVRGFARTFRRAIDRLDHLVDLGIDVIELMPVHPFDSTTNYWGYMPLVWGAVHEEYAEPGSDPAVELAEFVAAAHARGIRVWLDVVFNHTAEEDEIVGTTTSWRAIADERAYRRTDGRLTNDSGCGNDTNVAEPEMQRLILEALHRYASLGIDGFRFDLASLLTRDGGGLVRRIGDWAEACGIRLIAEAWDLGAYQVGSGFPDDRWSQWNDRFREDVRGFLRAEPGLVPGLLQRVAGSPDLFPGTPWSTVNFIDAHDGLTLFDLTAVTDDHHRAWDCGPELRMQQLKNAFCYLLLSVGSPMFVMGDEFGRTQGGDPNPYRTDSPVTWVDWSRLDEWRELYEFVRSLIALRRAHPVEAPTFHGVGPDGPDGGYESRSLAWSTDHVVVFANTWWESLTFHNPRSGVWKVALATADVLDAAPGGTSVTVAARSVVVLTR